MTLVVGVEIFMYKVFTIFLSIIIEVVNISTISINLIQNENTLMNLIELKLGKFRYTWFLWPRFLAAECKIRVEFQRDFDRLWDWRAAYCAKEATHFFIETVKITSTQQFFSWIDNPSQNLQKSLSYIALCFAVVKALFAFAFSFYP